MLVTVAVAAVGTAFGLEGGLHLYKIRSKAMQHVLDYTVWPNPKSLVSHFSGHMPISKMPRKANKLIGIFMLDFNNELRRRLNLQPPAIFELQPISIAHRNRLGKVEKDILALIRRQAKAAAVAHVKIERESACRLLLRPMVCGAMSESVVHRHIST